jgi:hypothetical protein
MLANFAENEFQKTLPYYTILKKYSKTKEAQNFDPNSRNFV